MNSDSEEENLPEEIGEAASDGDFERAKAWLAGGSASAPRSVNSSDGADWTLLHWTVVGDLTPEHIEFARNLISRGCPVDAQSSGPLRAVGYTALHCACQNPRGDAAPIVALLVTAGANVNIQAESGATPLFSILEASASTLDIVTTLLRAGASLDSESIISDDDATTRTFEEQLNHIDRGTEHDVATKNLVASVRAAGSWKAHCRRPHKQILRLRSLVARGRTRERLATTRAIRFVVRQGDNGIVWNILSYWRETG